MLAKNLLEANSLIQSIIIDKKNLTSTALNKMEGTSRMLVLAVLRHYWALNFFIDQLLKKPIKNKDIDLYFLILEILYLLNEEKISPYTVVNQGVIAAKKLKPWGSSLVNAIARNFIRQHKKLVSLANQIEESRYNHPQWLIHLIQRDWPDKFEAILSANNAVPPLFLRVNTSIIPLKEYCQKLKNAKVDFEWIPGLSETLMLPRAIQAEKLPGFSEGEIYIQDAAAQWAADLLELESHQKILDACAAPGGKLSHILQRFPHMNVIALEKEERRIDLIKENLSRLKLQAKILSADAAEVSTWWDGEYFDRILLDAPCSSIGIIRRHPDIKHGKKPEDIIQAQTQQMRLIKALWPLLKSGGIMLYCTCSVARQENDEIIQYLLENYSDVVIKEIPAAWGSRTHYGIQIIPGEYNMDGLYYAKLQKKPWQCQGFS